MYNTLSLEDKERPNLRHKLLIILIYVLFIRDISLLFGFYSLASLLFTCLYLVMGLLFYLNLILSIHKSETIKYWIHYFIGIFLIIILYSIAANKVGTNILTNAKSTVGIIMIIAFMISESSISINERSIRIFLNLNLVHSICLLLAALLPQSYNYDVLVFYYNNPNQAGLHTFLSFGALFVQYIYQSKSLLRKRLIILFCMVFMLYLCYITASRASLFSCISIIFIFLFSTRKTKSLNKISWLFLLMPFLIPAIWVFLINIVPINYMILGKPIFSGREIIWNNIFHVLLENPIRANFQSSIPFNGLSRYRDSVGSHNAFLGLAWNYSLPVMIMIFYLFFNKIRNCIRGRINMVSLSIVSVLLSLFIHMSFEETLISGGLDFMMKGFLFISLIRGVKNDV